MEKKNINLTNLQARNLFSALSEVKQQKLNFKLQHAISSNISQLKNAYEEGLKLQNQLIQEKYGDKKENGDYFVPNEKYNDFVNEFIEILNSFTEEYKLYFFDFNQFENIEISGNDFEFIKPIIEEKGIE